MKFNKHVRKQHHHELRDFKIWHLVHYLLTYPPGTWQRECRLSILEAVSSLRDNGGPISFAQDLYTKEEMRCKIYTTHDSFFPIEGRKNIPLQTECG